MPRGHPIRFPPCPLCQQPVKSASSPYFKCGCRRYIVRDGQLCPARPRATPKKATVKKQAQGPVGQVREPMEWWEYEAMQDARPERQRQ
jgi:hypothetical protein